MPVIETKIIRHTASVTFRCKPAGKVGNCGHTLQIVFEKITTRTTTEPVWGGFPKTHATHSFIAPDGSTSRDIPGIVCPADASHGFMFSNEIHGTKNDEACGSRCLNAKGPSCECSCGGANHGAGHRG